MSEQRPINSEINITTTETRKGKGVRKTHALETIHTAACLRTNNNQFPPRLRRNLLSLFEPKITVPGLSSTPSLKGIYYDPKDIQYLIETILLIEIEKKHSPDEIFRMVTKTIADIEIRGIVENMSTAQTRIRDATLKITTGTGKGFQIRYTYQLLSLFPPAYARFGLVDETFFPRRVAGTFYRETDIQTIINTISQIEGTHPPKEIVRLVKEELTR